MSEWEYRYFVVRQLDDAPGRKTAQYGIYNRRSGLRLGTIQWFGPWRQFCFLPDPFTSTVWSDGCLKDLRNAINKAKDVRQCAINAVEKPDVQNR